MKIAVVGGGSTYTPELVDGIGRMQDALPVDELVLIDPAEDRLALVGALGRRMLQRHDHPGVLTTTSDLDAGVDGADAVLLQLRVGGQAARGQDETWPLECGCVGQETTGAGGLAKALRTVPVVLDIASRVQKASPDAWIVDFTNPVGIVTRALLEAGHRAVGLCNVAIGFQRRFADMLGVEPARVRLDHVGLNHLTWERRVLVDGRDRLPELLGGHVEEIAEALELPPWLLRQLGVVPSYYLRYFYAHDEVVRELRASPSRAARVAEIEQELLQLYADERLDTKPELLTQRGGAFYSEAAVDLCAHLLGSSTHAEEQVVNMRNGEHAPLPAGGRGRGGPGSGRRRCRDVAAGRAPRTALRGAGGCGHRLRGPGSRGGPAGRPRAGVQGAARPSARGAGRPRRGADRPVDRAQRGVPAMGVNAAVLAVDAGNSKTDVAVVSDEGEVLGSARGPGFLPHIVQAETAVGSLHVLVEQAAADAGIVDPTGMVRHVSACLANVDLPVEQQVLEEAVEARAWGATSAVFNDTYALLRAGLDEPHGIAVICGAGINCTGRRRDGQEVRFAAVGHISGDWGGGGFLWSEAMWWAARAADGRGPGTALADALPAHFGLPSMEALIEAVHLGHLTRERCVEMTPLLFDVAAGGDRIATDVVRRQAAEVAALAVASLTRLELLDQPTPVVLGGGVLTAGHRMLLDGIDEELASSAPKAFTRVVTTPLVVGAGLLGLDHVSAPDSAKERLRARMAPAGER